jgi:hypothetical protein
MEQPIQIEIIGESTESEETHTYGSIAAFTADCSSVTFPRGSLAYDLALYRKGKVFNKSWATYEDFERWKDNRVVEDGIELRIQRTPDRGANYLERRTFTCARNYTGGLSRYEKKTEQTRKVESKKLDESCPCKLIVKTYPDNTFVLGSFTAEHNHPVGSDNLKYTRLARTQLLEVKELLKRGCRPWDIVSI